eukprot:TRINITY_DN24948_c1_g1_i1.p1 TRINITY_DN24948_c1_g1~~TRINITY_DN24948_c1_g1_i1.p1  ORF type:complete len:107 (+),score=9.50 TRINITY_DN24948_c1_g1_i1:145-465(+)
MGLLRTSYSIPQSLRSNGCDLYHQLNNKNDPECGPHNTPIRLPGTWAPPELRSSVVPRLSSLAILHCKFHPLPKELHPKPGILPTPSISPLESLLGSRFSALRNCI